MKTLCLLLLALIMASQLFGQTPAPIVVPAATPAPVTTTLTAPPTPPGQSDDVTSRLRAMKAANDEILRRQAETLQRLDELQKAADQLKIYSKRG